MKTYRQFVTETEQKKKKSNPVSVYHVGHAVFGSHSIPLHDRMLDQKVHEDSYSIPSGKDSAKKVADLDSHYKLDKDDKKAVTSYTLQSAHLNESLLHKHLNPTDHFHAADHERMHGAQVKKMDTFLSKHKTKEDMHVYTGSGFSPERYKDKNHQKDQPIKVHLPSYTSSSIHQHVAEDFAKHDAHEDNKGAYKDHHHMLKIHVPKDSHGAYLGKHSQFPEEHEFVLPRDSKIHVHPEPTVHHPLGKGKKPIAIWHAKLVHGDKE